MTTNPTPTLTDQDLRNATAELRAALEADRKEVPTQPEQEDPTPKQPATPRKPRAKTAGLSVIQDGIEVTENRQRNGVEIRLSRSDAVVVAELQSHGFRRSRTHGCWYAPLRDDTKAFAYSLQLVG